MPALFIFLLKVNAALLLFCAGYYLVLRHLTFYTLNRVYLVAAILFATIYPEINLTGFLERHQQIAKPIQVVAINWQAPAKALVAPVNKPDYWFWAEMVLWAGVAVLAIRLFIQLLSLYKLYRGSTAARIHNHDVRVINSDTGPFSFWKSIFINPDKHEPADLKSILQHEQVHVSEWHTLDVLLAELSTIFYWFNPGVWLMKKAVKENIEFITDRKILRSGTDSKQYQYSLVNVSFASAPQGIVNHFNISTIKKRIIMMNTKRSSKFTLTRYVFLVPAVIALLLVFSISKAAYIKNTIHANKAIASKIINLITVDATSVKNNKSAATNSAINLLTAKFTGVKINLKLIDTIRKGSFFLSSDEKTDSLNYVINGVKSTKADLMKLDPKNINSVSIFSEKDKGINSLIKGLDTNHGTILITTSGSEDGRKFKEKIDDLSGNRYTVLANTDYKLITASSAKVVTVVGRPPKGSSSTAIASVNVDNDSDDAITGVKGSVSNVVIVGEPAKVLKFKQMKGDSLYISRYKQFTSNGNTVVAGYGKPDSVGKVALKLREASSSGRTYSNYTFTYNAERSPDDNSSRHNSETNISHLSSRLVMIDGKEANEKDLKKLSAADIDSMSVQTGDAMTKKYGDKAKKGVLFITTKKAVNNK